MEIMPPCEDGPIDPSLERTFRGHKNYVTSVNFSPSLKQLASGSADNCVLLWNFRPQLRAFRFVGHKDVVTDVQFSPGGDVLASASKDSTVRLWLPTANGSSSVMKSHTAAVRSVKFSCDSRYLVTASNDKLVKIWALPARTFLCSFVGHSNWVRSANFNMNTQLVVSGGDDKQVKLWDVMTHQCLHTFHDHTDIVNSVIFLGNGNCIGSVSADRTLKLWDIRSHQLIQHYPAHSAAVTGLSAHPSGNYVLTSSKDSSLKIWDIREGRLLYTLHGHTGPVNAATISSDGNFFASGGADQLVMVWKANLLGSSNVVPNLDWSNTSEAVKKKSTSDLDNSKSPLFKNAQQIKQLKPSSIKIVKPKTSSTVPKVTIEDPPTVSQPINQFSRPLTTSTDSNISNTISATERENLPEGVVLMLDHIVGQLNVIMKTMAVLDHRLTITEDRLSTFMAESRGLLQMKPQISSTVIHDSADTSDNSVDDGSEYVMQY